MEKYIYDENSRLWYELHGEYYILCLALPAENKTSLSVYVWGSSTNAICENTNRRFTLLCSQEVS